MRWLALAALLPVILASSAVGQVPDSLLRVRQLYLEAVRDESAIPRGMRAIEEVRAAGEAPGGSSEDALLSAYRGALVTLRAKHGLWPPARLRHLREGLAILDRSVAARPDHPEIRYLRLLSCYFLPGILGRGETVREDFDALATLLPAARDAYPPELYGTMVRFVLENGGLEAGRRRPLEAALAAADA